MGYLFALVFMVIGYFVFQTEAPTPIKPWRPYATNSESGRPEWAASWGATYATKDECQFNAAKAIGHGYREPSGCVYNGYQNAIVLGIVNSIIAPNAWKCVVRHTRRDKFEDPVFEIILRGFPESEGDGWKCV